jgi:MFS family permease
MTSIVSFRASPERDPDGSKLQEIFDCHFAYDRVHMVREALVYALAAVSVGTGLMAMHPGIVSGVLARLVLALWIGCLMGAAVAGAAEWRLHRRRARLLAGVDPHARSPR